VVPDGDGGVLFVPPPLLPLQPITPPITNRQRAAASSPPRQRRRGNAPRKISAAKANPVLLNFLSSSAIALAAVVETVSVLEPEEVPVICACDGLRAQVGGLFGVPWPR
jgi:hypothetical protein